MIIIDSILNWVMKKRIHQIELFMKYPEDVQQETFGYLINTAKNTEWGLKYDYKSIRSYDDFTQRVPISNYEKLFPYIDRLMKGENNLLWPGTLKWFAKSSGTTNAKSKFIPVSTEALENCHFNGGKDMLSLYVNNYEERSVFSGKCLTICGSHQINPLNPKTSYGDVSAVIFENLPLWAKMIRTPSPKTSLMEQWEDKIIHTINETRGENVTSMAGVPTWTLLILQKLLEKEGKENIREIWPNLELFFHGAVSFGPYKDLFKKLIPFDDMYYQEIYNASEGFFAIQDQPKSDDLLLMLDYGVFYEFIPMNEFGLDNPKTLLLDQVSLDTNYAILISTNAGLWRYVIGDTVRFTSLYPFRIKITGRTKHFINAFGEELMIENVEIALKQACSATDACIANYSGAPVYLQKGKSGCHEWLIEFETAPADYEAFESLFDENLQKVNSDYEAKREKGMALGFPKFTYLQEGSFYSWMSSRGKLGGQHKVPRLCNTRQYADDILSHAKKNDLILEKELN